MTWYILLEEYVFVLTLDRWASSISRKESVVLGSGRIVTTMIFELTTVKFLWGKKKQQTYKHGSFSLILLNEAAGITFESLMVNFHYFSCQIFREKTYLFRNGKNCHSLGTITDTIKSDKQWWWQKCQSVKYDLLIRRAHWWHRHSVNGWVHIIHFSQSRPTSHIL